MKYFLHDTNALQDEKMTELYINHGYEGVGLFYAALEKLGAQEKPIKTAVLKAQLKVGKRLEKCWSFMEEIGIISSSNGETFNERILSYSETYEIKKQKNREKISQWRERQQTEKDVTSYEPVSNLPKVKESKVKESKDINTEPKGSTGTDVPLKKFDQESKELKKEFLSLDIPADAKDAWVSIKEWISTKKPQFIEPYVTAWNIYSSFYGFPAIQKINEKRRKHFGIRIRDPGFNFLEILNKAKRSDFLKTSGWFGFDWIIENDSNYLKIIEGNYK